VSGRFANGDALLWTHFPGANIGGRIPEPVPLIDVDPRNGGRESWAALERKIRPHDLAEDGERPRPRSKRGPIEPNTQYGGTPSWYPN
jgi:hypothetical protein